MIYSLRGELIFKNESTAVIECCGVGYLCHVPLSTASELGKCGNEQKLFTYMSIKEDSAELFGFNTLQELECFKMLISVSGVGAKAGLAILSDMTPDKIVLNVASQDSKAFTKVKGIGNKTAQRIILELKDKISKEKTAFSEIPIKNTSLRQNSSISEAFSALEALGYSNSEIMPIISTLDENLPSSELIKLALKSIASGKFR